MAPVGLTPPPFRRTLEGTMPAGFDAAFAKVAELHREQATMAGLAELKAKYEAKIAARLAAVWGEPDTVKPA